MIDFSGTTPFRLVRRLAAAGQNTPSVYLLFSEADAFAAVLADIAAEVKVQFGFDLRSEQASELRLEALAEAFTPDAIRPIVFITLNQWLPDLIDWLDRNVVLLTRSGGVLLLADPKEGERALAKAPNLRNRLTDVLSIRPEESFGGARA